MKYQNALWRVFAVLRLFDDLLRFHSQNADLGGYPLRKQIYDIFQIGSEVYDIFQIGSEVLDDVPLQPQHVL